MFSAVEESDSGEDSDSSGIPGIIPCVPSVLHRTRLEEEEDHICVYLYKSETVSRRNPRRRRRRRRSLIDGDQTDGENCYNSHQIPLSFDAHECIRDHFSLNGLLGGGKIPFDPG